MGFFASWIEPIGVCVTAAATIVLAYVTYVLAKETKRLAAAGSQPQVFVTIEPNLHSMIWQDINVENTGTAPAFDISICFDPEFSFEGRALPLSHIDALKPRQIVSSSLCDFAALQGKTYKITAEWAKCPGAKERESLSYEFDAGHLEGISRLGGVPEIDAVDHLKKMSESIERMSRGHNRLEVNVHTSEDRTREQAELEAWRQTRRRAVEVAPQTEPTEIKQNAGETAPSAQIPVDE